VNENPTPSALANSELNCGAILEIAHDTLVAETMQPDTEGQAMEMTEYGSMESHKAGFPPFPHSLEIPSGLPHSHGLDEGSRFFRGKRAKAKE
jgi:hypothetical protein